jgi:hypothetical protein
LNRFAKSSRPEGIFFAKTPNLIGTIGFDKPKTAEHSVAAGSLERPRSLDRVGMPFEVGQVLAQQLRPLSRMCGFILKDNGKLHLNSPYSIASGHYRPQKCYQSREIVKTGGKYAGPELE